MQRTSALPTGVLSWNLGDVGRAVGDRASVGTPSS